MSKETQTEDEPSIEEILDSIRQIISEDDDDDAEDESSSADSGDVSEPEVASEPLDQSAIDDMDFDTPMDQSAIDNIDFGSAVEEPSAPDEDPDVLELTERVEEPADEDDPFEVDMVDTEEDSVAEPAAEDIPDPIVPEEAPAAPVVEPVVAAPQKPAEPVSSDENILTAAAESAAISAMSELVRKTAVEHNGVTLEDIVRSELKPLLRTWLDKNLPIVIERLVREELERVSKRVLEE